MPRPLSDAEPNSVEVQPIRHQKKEEWDRLTATYHYLGFQKLVGKSLKYAAILNGQRVTLERLLK